MEFSGDEIIGEKALKWRQLIDELHKKKLYVEGSQTGSQWIFRALGSWEKNVKQAIGKKGTYRCDISSSFDEAWERPSEERKQTDKRLYESWMLFEFKREAYHYLADLPKPNNLLEWMALARHYEMPSRLLDFTYSFYVATYFALSTRGRRFERQQEKKDEDGCILAINLAWMKKQLEDKLKKEWCAKAGIKYEQASFHDPKLFRKFAFEWQECRVVPVAPLRRNPRLARQQGLFLCPGNVEKDFDENMRETIGSEPDVKRLIRLRYNFRSEALRDLRRMNINLSTLYADLSGWAESQGDLVHLKDISDDRFRQELENALKNPRI